MSAQDNLDQAILASLAYFDTFDYPLTLVEIHKWLYQYSGPVSLWEIKERLANSPLVKRVETKDGFYFLTGRPEIVTVRLRRYLLAEKKFKIARRAVYWLRGLGFIKLIAVCNNVGYNNGRAESDIDFFIIARQGHLWWTRLWVTFLMSLLGLRRHARQIVNRICLSFYLADNHFDLEDISLRPQDPYLAYWFATLAPIYVRHDSYQQFLAANGWLKKYLPNFSPVGLSARRRVQAGFLAVFSQRLEALVFSGWLGRLGEKLAKLIQQSKIRRYFGSAVNGLSTNVVIDDSILKFHKTDRRLQYRQLWQKKLNNLGYDS